MSDSILPCAKKCITCGELKPLSEYDYSRGRHIGQCKSCRKNRKQLLRSRQVFPTNLPPKKCRRCGETKPIDFFDRENSTLSGYRSVCKVCVSRYTRGVPREKLLNKKYSITGDKYESMLESQGGVCASCGDEEKTGRALAIDHNHGTGQVRALLCTNCNIALGFLMDDPERVEKLLDYIRRYTS